MPIKPPAKTAIDCDRYSTQEPASEGVSLDAQRDRLRAWCKLHIIHSIGMKADDGISGGTLQRPGLQATLADASLRNGEQVDGSSAGSPKSLRCVVAATVSRDG